MHLQWMLSIIVQSYACVSMQLLETTQMRLDSGNAMDTAEAGPEHQMPRVALLFLTRGAMPHQPAWRAFFHAAGRHTQGAAHRVCDCTALWCRCHCQQGYRSVCWHLLQQLNWSCSRVATASAMAAACGARPAAVLGVPARQPRLSFATGQHLCWPRAEGSRHGERNALAPQSLSTW
jgi:hypothetical protein